MGKLRVKTSFDDSLPGNANATNWPGKIKMRRGLKYQAAIWAQEAYEATHKLSIINRLLMLFPHRRRAMELMGQEIEVQVALWMYNADPEVYRRGEAQSLVYWYEDFSSFSEDECYDMLKERSYEAQKWAWKHEQEIREFL